ncbi:ZF-HD homeobox protein [Zostera marina]|uniref:ZF-HD homeobox protein n=1 Tax=Zostera marina TaxID=29655 RepID=A0A0K9P2X8_ZOSMR|nr:ZF-HD homeobox protein [Zostera marina]
MDYDDHDDDEEEIGEIPGGCSSYGTPPPPPTQLPNSSSTRPTPSLLTLAKQELTGGGTTSGGGVRKLSTCGNTSGRYRECLKNHAVGIGGHAVDGCGEFMAAGEDGTLDALKCAACNCHRNFHRKEVLESVGAGLGLMGITDTATNTGGNTTTTNTPSAFHHPHQPQFSAYYRTPTGYLHHHVPHRMAPPPLALRSSSGGAGSRDEDDMSDPMIGGSEGGGAGGGSSSKKRFRTRFTQEQKDKMLELAERLGWRMQKHDEGSVQQFCSDTGVPRHVFKVWMHNNKHTLGKSPTATATLIQQVPQLLHLQEREHLEIVDQQHHHQQQQQQMGSSG